MVFLKISKLIGNLNAQKIISWKIYSKSFFSCKVFSLTDIGEGIHEVALKKWFIKEGDKIEQFQDICEVQSDKSSVVITSRYDGIISKVHHDVDSIIKVGDSLVSIETDDLLLDNVTNSTFEDTESNMKKDNTNSIHNMSNDSVNKSHSKNNKKIMTTPAIRRMASEHDIDLSIIKGTGPNNRIIKEDMLLYLAENKTYENHEKSKSQEQLYLDSDTDSLCNSEIKLNMFQRSMCKNMQKSILVPQFGLCDIVEMDEMISLRRIFNKNDEQITFMPIFIKACSFALKEFPILNGVFDSENLSIQLNNNHNISFALDTPHGLMVPNIKNVEKKSIIEISKEMKRIIKYGMQNQLLPHDVLHGTFTLSNIGSIGGTYAMPIIMPPQLCIGAIGKISEKLKLNDIKDKSISQVYSASYLNISWSADHRVIDGATMTKFSNLWKKYIEHPLLMLKIAK